MMKHEHFHLLGIGGIGMSALARILLQRGAFVSGSDLGDGEQLRSLRLLGARAFAGHSKDHISALPPSAQIVCSSSIKIDHLERTAAVNRGLFICHRADVLQKLALEKATFGVAGSHGKTSTSALLTWLLAGEDHISFALGGMLKQSKSNGQWRDKGPFIAEVDESDGKSFAIPLMGGILTNVASDHLSHWKSLEQLCCGFDAWSQSIKDQALFVHSADDQLCCQIARKRGWSFGFAPSAHYRIANVRRFGWSTLFDLHLPKNRVWTDLALPLFGDHQLLNAAAALAFADRLQIDPHRLRERLLSFQGVSRRAELKRSYCIGTHRVPHFDDYAHHPNEVRAFLKGVRSAIGDLPLIAFFQPHRYTRLRDCFDDYIEAFDAVDQLWICPLYSAGESSMGLDSSCLAKALALRAGENDFRGEGVHRRLQFAKLWRGDSALLRFQLAKGGVLCTLGAGDIDRLNFSWLEDF